MSKDNPFRTIRRVAIGTVIGLVVIVGGCSSFTIVPYGNVGVTKTFGKLGADTLGEGLNFKTPFIESVIKVNVQVQKMEVVTTAVSKDQQPITTKFVVNYSVNKDSANELLQNVGTNYESKIISPAVPEVVKAVTAKYSAEQLTGDREMVSAGIHEGMAARMKPYGLTINEINVIDLDFSDAFNASIEAKQIAAQKALQAKNDLQRIEIEGKQKIVQAQAEAESLKLKKQEITPELVQLKQIEVQEQALQKWDGKLPVVSGGATPFIDLQSLTKTK